MRISLIGPGDINFHYFQLLGLDEKKFNLEIEEIARNLVESRVEIELLPDKGVCLEMAKLYKKLGGKKVVGAIPKSDKTFGIAHLEQYVNSQVEGKPLFDELIDTENWFKHDLIKGLLGDAVLYLGASPGTDGERNYAIYLYKIISGFKNGVEASAKKIHTEIKAGKNYTFLVYSKFLASGRLPKEDEAYMKKFGVNLVYVDSASDLKEKLKKF